MWCKTSSYISFLPESWLKKSPDKINCIDLDKLSNDSIQLVIMGNNSKHIPSKNKKRNFIHALLLKIMRYERYMIIKRRAPLEPNRTITKKVAKNNNLNNLLFEWRRTIDGSRRLYESDIEYIDSSSANAGRHVMPYNIPIKELKTDILVSALRNMSMLLIDIIERTIEIDIIEYFIASLNIYSWDWGKTTYEKQRMLINIEYEISNICGMRLNVNKVVYKNNKRLERIRNLDAISTETPILIMQSWINANKICDNAQYDKIVSYCALFILSKLNFGSIRVSDSKVIVHVKSILNTYKFICLDVSLYILG